MCGRYTIVTKAEAIKDRFNVAVPETYKTRYNAAPTQILPVITNKSPESLSFFHWGSIPSWSKDKSISTKLINVWAETLEEKASLKNTLKQRRCLVIADGFYEWKIVGKKTKIPYRIKLKTDELFSFAGLWEEFDTENGDIMHTFTIITTVANNAIADIHERMPVILDKRSESVWLNDALDTEDHLNILKSYSSEKFSIYTVSPRVNNVHIDEPDLINFSSPADQLGNYTLFN